jgi:predicted PurR-regulated permease PerM
MTIIDQRRIILLEYTIFNRHSAKLSIMKNQISIIGIALSILFVATATSSVSAQNVTTNMSNTAGNVSASANQTMGELGQNASSAMNQTGESVNATMGELGKNVTDAGQTALNKTGEALKGVGSGAADVLGNISGEIKEGIGAK